MARKSTKTQAAVSILDQPLEENKSICVRNQTRNTITVHALGFKGEDVVIPLLSEAVVDPSWVKNRELREYIKNGTVSVAWVDEWHKPSVLPSPDNAPDDIRPDNPLERQFAFQIATADDVDAIELANTKVRQRGNTQLDLPYMRNKMVKVLATADWLEERVRNRSKVRKMIQVALKKAQAL